MTVNISLRWILGWTIAIVLQPTAIAQLVPDRTTQLETDTPNLYRITGGDRSSDGSNLFHQFSQFHLQSGDTAQFVADPSVRNILSTTLHGPTIVDGQLQVAGSAANLYLIDPAGIIFGETAHLNVAGDFFAIAATAIGFGTGDRRSFWDTAIAIDPESVNGDPLSFELLSAGEIVNRGTLQLSEDRTLGLLGGCSQQYRFASGRRSRRDRRSGRFRAVSHARSRSRSGDRRRSARTTIEQYAIPTAGFACPTDG